jgi:uncharacterized protein YegP (UPF0339 family)
MAAKFVLKRGTTGKFRFNLLATNGQVIATSESYESKAAALSGIKSVQANAAGAGIDDQTAPASGAAKKAPAKKATRATKKR